MNKKLLLIALLLGIPAASQLRADNGQSSSISSGNQSLISSSSQDNSQGNQSSSSSQDNSQVNSLPDPYLSSQATLSLKWKYGWADANRANTLGSAANHDPLPKASYYISTGYSPQQIINAYGFNQLPAGDTGAGQIIALIEAYGSTNIQSDLNAFDTNFGIPATTVKIAYPNGKTTNTDYSWAFETTQDVEWAHALAPGATIWVIVEPDASLTHLLAGIAYAGATVKSKIVSMSWGVPEFSTEKNYDTYFTNQTITYIASAGDNQDTNWPSTSPYVLAVGGTSMFYDTNAGAISSETGWDGSYDINVYGPGWGGGGGFSKYEKQPQYQIGYTGFTNNSKAVPDCSYDADPYTGVSLYFTPPGTTVGGWFVGGGTSLGAPSWAAIASCCNWSTLKPGKLNFIWDIYNQYFYATTDIITGSNGVYPCDWYYDLATGMGTPVVRTFGEGWNFGYPANTIYY